MAVTDRIWASNLNVVISDSLTPDQKVQYREAFLQLHLCIQAAGWTVERSSDGTTAGVGNNITTLADVVIGDDPSEAHSWATYSPPSGWLNTSNVMELCINIDELFDTVPGVTNPYPQVARMIVSAGVPFTGGTTLTRATSVNEYVMPNLNFLSNSSGVVDMHAHMAWTSAGLGHSGGEWWFALSEDGTNDFETFIGLGTPDYTLSVNDGGPDNPDNAWFAFYTDDRPETIIRGGDELMICSKDATFPAPARALLVSAADEITTLPDGVFSSSGKPLTTSIDGVINEAGVGRFLGKWPDVYQVPQDLEIGIVEDGDTQPVRFVSIGNLYVPVTASQLPLIG